MTEESRQFLKKADHALEVAEAFISDGYPSDAASKIKSRAGGNAQTGRRQGVCSDDKELL